jgi:hypothetical protein
MVGLLFSILAAHLEGIQLRAATVHIYPGANIAKAVSNNPSGTTFVIHPGLYRLQAPIAAKNRATFTGQSGSILSGARLLTSFRHTGSYYYVTGQTQQGQVTIPNRRCESGYPRCNYPEDLYFDDVPLVHVAALSDLGPGKWFFDYPNATIYFYDNPAGHRVETSVIPKAFNWRWANNVTIQGLTVEKFATPMLFGAIGGAAGQCSTTTGANWVVKNNEIRLNHGNGVRINFGWQVLNNDIHHNGNLGIGGGLSNTTPSRVLIQGNELAYNNYAHVKTAFQGGGLKLSGTLKAIIRGNNSQHNDGDGFHTDIAGRDVLYDGNIAADNTQVGIIDEISYAATIRNNKLLRNGYIHPTGTAWMYAANLLSATSKNVEAYCNTVEVSAQGGNGINILAQNRPGYNPSTDNYFHHNTVVFDGNSGWTGATRDESLQDPNFYSLNRFDYNTYHLPSLSLRPFVWIKFNTFAQFGANGQDVHGSADTNYTGSVPAVAITSPADGSTVSGITDVNGSAQDDNIEKVEFYVDWNLGQTQYASRFSFPWQSYLFPNGNHTIAAMAYDKAGMRACYAATFNVQN